MKIAGLDELLWAAGFIGHVALFLVLMFRGRWRAFPVFTSLIGYQALVTAVLFVTYRIGTRHAYVDVYWTTAAGDFLFQLALIYEIASAVLRPTGTWVADARKTFLLGSGAGILVALVTALMVTPAASSLLSTLEARGAFFTSLLICELFLAMIASANRLGLQWRSHVVALGQGLTVWAIMALISDAANSFGWIPGFLLRDHIRMFFYLGALVYWMGAFWLPERERAPLSPEMRNYLVALHSRVQYDLERSSSSKPLL